ncbi:UDP-N-acetylmuramoyl-tripeptide--D-alanyl-D-alanine ligase [Janthinobacterium psychrotolerans]|uniref:UDP-N-acetylmuramoyl-tripeptide--D-alanyl-D-alanine ligase n=1 Tax=Janthinobacterium psychrotolerans TaxID=1747903 RepID=A0A1A7C4A5_9BURK|nr:UDP-N-acetylmuramoyl-tripeptide--D-alanyl-D-alanine ligase [Janthinobacterium psychrotolerans]
MEQTVHATLAQVLPVLASAGTRLAGRSDTPFAGVTTDSRQAGAGALFVALRGERFDAHDFLLDVARQGVAAVIVEDLPEGWDDSKVAAIVVPDTLVALGRIANFWRRQFDLPVIGVTGSNGKTTVKEMLSSILAAAFGEQDRLATRGNLNNEIGVPLTLFRLAAHHDAAVIEMGMNHPGEIARLAAIAEPTVAMVNNAQREHQEFMHTVEAVARENGAALAALPQDGVAVFPHGDEFTPLWQELAGTRRAILFGLSKDAEVSCTHRAAEDFGSDLFVSVRDEQGGVQQFFVGLQAAGEHNVKNALAAVACAFGAGVRLDAIKQGLEAFAPVAGRLQHKRAMNGATVIDDSYNANPDSARAAIDVLAQAGAPRILVLGEMGEVGSQGQQFHEEIGAYAAAKGIEHVLATGGLARHMVASGNGAGTGTVVEYFEQFDGLLAALDALLAARSDATVLIKGSRFMKMERAVQHLIGSNNNKEAH